MNQKYRLVAHITKWELQERATELLQQLHIQPDTNNGIITWNNLSYGDAVSISSRLQSKSVLWRRTFTRVSIQPQPQE